MTEPELPTYDWQRARIGDEATSVTVEVAAADIRGYVTVQRDANPAYAEGAPGGSAVPPVLVRHYAPLRRRELVEENRARYPDYPTPAVLWRCRFHAAVRVGDRITSTTRVSDKFVRKERHFVEWQVNAANQRGEPVADFTYVNLWDRGRPEDRTR
jgi:acyl dehydratase